MEYNKTYDPEWWYDYNWIHQIHMYISIYIYSNHIFTSDYDLSYDHNQTEYIKGWQCDILSSDYIWI